MLAGTSEASSDLPEEFRSCVCESCARIRSALGQSRADVGTAHTSRLLLALAACRQQGLPQLEAACQQSDCQLAGRAESDLHSLRALRESALAAEQRKRDGQVAELDAMRHFLSEQLQNASVSFESVLAQQSDTQRGKRSLLVPTELTFWHAASIESTTVVGQYAEHMLKEFWKQVQRRTAAAAAAANSARAELVRCGQVREQEPTAAAQEQMRRQERMRSRHLVLLRNARGYALQLLVSTGTQLSTDRRMDS